VLDILRVPLLEPRPKAYQTENWLLDPEYYWERVGRAAWPDLSGMTDSPASLWANTSSTRQGENDRVAMDEADRLECSLYLLRLPSLSLRIFAPGADFGRPKRRVQASFRYHSSGYKIWVTDPVIEQEYLAKQNDAYDVGECFMVVSLGEPHEDGFAYKLAATIVTPKRAGR
jgi:hypothetical protein